MTICPPNWHLQTFFKSPLMPFRASTMISVLKICHAHCPSATFTLCSSPSIWLTTFSSMMASPSGACYKSHNQYHPGIAFSILPWSPASPKVFWNILQWYYKLDLIQHNFILFYLNPFLRHFLEHYSMKTSRNIHFNSVLDTALFFNSFAASSDSTNLPTQTCTHASFYL